MTDSSNSGWRSLSSNGDRGSDAPGSGSAYSSPPPPPPGMSRTERLHGPGAASAAAQAQAAVEQVPATAKTGGQAPKKKWGKRIGLGILFTLLALVIAGAAGFMWLYSRISVPEPSEFALAQTTTVYFSDGETEMGQFAEVNRTIIDIDALPSYVSEAIVASEDRTFHTNVGIDLKGIARAFWNNVRGGAQQGGSTLTQQYVETYFGRETSGYKDKLIEAMTALKINREQSKETILSNYMNTIYFGRGAYGIEAASEAYFGKPAEQLTLSEAAMLAGIIPAPSAWDPAISPEMAQERWERVLNLMAEDGWISESEAQSQTFPETIEPKQSTTSMTGWKGYLLQQVRQELVDEGAFSDTDIDAGGYSIISTIDPMMQQAAVDAVAVMPEDTPDSVRIAISAVDNKTGEIVAEYGGSDYEKVQINAATQDIAMAGSTFKPFSLVPFLEGGGSMQDRFDGNSPLEIGNLVVNNNGGVSYGQASVNDAVKYSINTVFAEINEVVGPQNTMDALIAAGIPEDTPGLEPTLLNVLGSASPHNIDLTHAYSTLANGGQEVKPHIVREVKSPSGNVIYQAVPELDTVFSSETISAMLPALESVPAQVGDTVNGQLLNGHKVAGKTGTAEEFKAAAFAAFIPQMTATVSMYNVGENGESLPLPNIGGLTSFYGGDWPADVWFAFMRVATADLPVESFAWFDPAAVQTEVPQSTQAPTEEPTEEPEEPEETETPTPTTPPVTEPEEPEEPEEPAEPTEPTEPTEPGDGGEGGEDTGGDTNAAPARTSEWGFASQKALGRLPAYA